MRTWVASHRSSEGSLNLFHRLKANNPKDVEKDRDLAERLISVEAIKAITQSYAETARW